MMKDKRNLAKWIGLIILIVLVVFLINKFSFLKGYGPEEIKNYIGNKGIMTPVIYVVLLSLLPLLLFPDSILVIAGGMVFGLFKGTILTSVGSLIGGIIAFYISRIFGSAVVRKIIKRDIAIFENNNKRSAFFVILMLRLIPLFPFKVVSYSAGLTDMKLKDFSLATVIGSLPGIIVYTNLGDKATAFGSREFYISIVLVVILFLASFAVKKVFERKKIVNKNKI